MKTFPLIRVILLRSLLAAAALPLLGCPGEEETAGRAIIALVNGEMIPLSEINAAFKDEEAAQIDPETLKVLRRERLDQLIEKRLLLQEAKRRSIRATDQEIRGFLQQQKEDYTQEEFDKLLKSKKMDPEKWEEAIKEDYLINKLIAGTMIGTAAVTETELASYYEEHRQEYKKPEEVKLRQIVVASKEEAKTIRQRLLSGEDFDALATRNSISPDRTKGGDMGYFSKGQMPEEFDRVFKLPVGAISPIVNSPYGYHIFRVEERREERHQTLQEVREAAYRKLIRQKQDRLLAEWIRELKTQAEIHVNTALLITEDASEHEHPASQ